MSSPARADAPAVVTPALLRGWPLPPPGGDKKARGSVLVVGGAARSPGAALLAGVAALRAGAGRLQLAVARSAAPSVSVAVPEALVVPLAETGPSGSIDPACVDDLADLAGAADVVCIGPGLDDADLTTDLVAAVVPHLPDCARVVLDAYALGALPRLPDVVTALRGRAVLTPNAREGAILLGRDDSPGEDELDGVAREIAQRYGVAVTLRGHVAEPDGGSWVDGSGASGLGTSGSGDVLAGVVAGLLGRGAGPVQAAVWGGHVHATAGERLAARVGAVGYLARELLDEVPLVVDELSVG